MACEFICDGCGKRQSGVVYPMGDSGWHKPGAWFQRQDADGARDIQDACSRACIERIAEKSGKTGVVLPV
jgi:hypothetical protein